MTLQLLDPKLVWGCYERVNNLLKLHQDTAYPSRTFAVPLYCLPSTNFSIRSHLLGFVCGRVRQSG